MGMPDVTMNIRSGPFNKFNTSTSSFTNTLQCMIKYLQKYKYVDRFVFIF